VPQTSLAKLAVTSPSARASSAAASSAAASSAAASSAAASTPPCAMKRRSGSGFALALFSLRPCARLFHSAPLPGGASSAAASSAAASSAAASSAAASSAAASTPPCAMKRRSGSGFALALYSLRPCARLFL
jgi:hypothetical protein